MSVLIRCQRCLLQKSIPELLKSHYKRCERCQAPIKSDSRDPLSESENSQDIVQTFKVSGQHSFRNKTSADSALAQPTNAFIQEYKDQLSQDRLFSPHAELVFKDLGELGQGGMGVVRKVQDMRLGRVAALKIMLGQSNDTRAQKRFIREAKTTASLNHPSIPPIYEIGRTASGSLYFLMKLVDGKTLKSRIENYHRLGRSPTELRELIEVLSRTCEALAYAHEQGFLHRDLKSDNIMVGDFGEVLVMDWGLAKDIASKDDSPDLSELSLVSIEEGMSSGLTIRGAVLGTPGYMAPEQAEGSDLDERSDIFSLGIILCEILTGQIPIEGRSLIEFIVATISGNIRQPKEILPTVPAELNSLTMRTLALHREERPESVLMLRKELNAWLTGTLLESHKYSAREKTLLCFQNHPGKVLSSFAAVLVLIIVTLPFFVSTDRSKSRPPEKVTTEQILASQELLNKAKLQALWKLDGAIIQATVNEALQLTRRSEASLLAAASIYHVASMDSEQKACLVECEKRFPPAHNALLQLHNLEMKNSNSIDPIVTPSLKKLLESAEKSGQVNEYTLFAQAWLAQANKDYGQAIELYTRIQKHTLGMAQAYHARGKAQAALNENQKALADYNRAISLDPNDSEVYFSRCILNTVIGRIDDALEDSNRMLALNPNSAPYLRKRGSLKQSKGNHEGALKDYSLAIKFDPKDHSLKLNRAEAYISLNQTLLGLADLEFVSKHDPKNYICQSFLGSVYFKQKRYQSAVDAFTQAIQIDSLNTAPYLNRARCFQAQGNYTRALADYDTCLKNHPQSWRVYLEKGHCHFLQKEYNDAERAYNLCNLYNSSNQEAILGLARCWRNLGQERFALKFYNDLITMNPKHGSALLERGLLFRNFKEYNNAHADFTSAISLLPNKYHAFHYRATVLVQQGQYLKALKDIMDAIELNPYIPDCYKCRGHIHWRLQQFKFALEDYNRAIRLNPNNPDYLHHRAKLKQEMNDLDGALADYSAAIARVQTDLLKAEIHSNRGSLYFQKALINDDKDNFLLALKDLQAALKYNPSWGPAHLGLAYTQYKRKDYAESIKSFQKALLHGCIDSEIYYCRGISYAQLGQTNLAILDLERYLKDSPKGERPDKARQKLKLLRKDKATPKKDEESGKQ